MSYRWVSEKDNGHGDALNKGFLMTIGDIMCWLNSDDVYLNNAFRTVSEVFRQFSSVKWVTGLSSKLYKNGTLKSLPYLEKYKYKNIYSFLIHNYKWIQQESTFWRRDLWETAGGRINTDYKFMVDGELWCRFFLYENLYHVHSDLGAYRLHDRNRALLYLPQVMTEMEKAIHALALQAPPRTREIAKNLLANAPVRKMNQEDLNFKIIEKPPGKTKWQLIDVDFFAYTLKDQAEQIRKIFNSNDYKTGSVLIAPLRWAFQFANKLFIKLTSLWYRFLKK